MNFQDTAFVPGGETPQALRKRVLMAILTREEMARAGLHIEHAELEAMARWFRGRFDLLTRGDLQSFLGFAGLSHADFDTALRDFIAIGTIEATRVAQIDGELPRYRAMLSVRDYLLRKESR
jgi:hypothetical protein